MLGSSRGSMANVSKALDAQRGAEGFGTLSSDLFAVADLLVREKSLRSALADSGQPEAGRVALARSIFEGRISALSVDVVAQAVAQRWSQPNDLVTAIEHLAAQAAFTVAESNGTLDATEEEIFRFGRAVDASADLQMTLTDPSLPASVKANVVRDVLAGRSTAATLEVLQYTAGHLGGRRLDSAVDDLAELAAAQRERVVAEVRVAAPLEDAQAARLAEILGRMTGRTVRLNVAIDPTILGGVHVKVGDEVIDGTVATRFEQARRAVLG